MSEINKKLLEDDDTKNNNEDGKKKTENDYINKEEGLELEEDESNNNNCFISKNIGILTGLVCLIGVFICFFDGGVFTITPNKNINQSLLSDLNTKTLRHLERKIEIEISEDYGDSFSNDNSNLPISIEDFNKLQMCHNNLTFEIYSNSKNEKPQNGKLIINFQVQNFPL